MLHFFAGSSLGYYRLANHNKRGLDMYSIERMLGLDDDEIDLGTAALIISRDWGTARQTMYRYREMIDDMAEEILTRMEAKRVGADSKAIPIINKYLCRTVKGYHIHILPLIHLVSLVVLFR